MQSTFEELTSIDEFESSAQPHVAACISALAAFYRHPNPNTLVSLRKTEAAYERFIDLAQRGWIERHEKIAVRSEPTKSERSASGNQSPITQVPPKHESELEMAGIMVFRNVSEALRAGYHVYDRTANGYLVRTRTSGGWALAIVDLRRGP